MSILIKGVLRRDPFHPDDPPKWYPVQNSSGMVGETRVAELIADETTLNSSEALMAIRQLRKVIEGLVQDGHSIKLGNWGSFTPSLKTHGAASKEDLTARNIDRVNLVFRMGEDLKAHLQKCEFLWIDKLVEGKPAQEKPAPDEGGDDVLS